MAGPLPLCRAVLLLSLCIQLQYHLPAAATPLSPGAEAHPGEASPKTQEMPPKDKVQVRSLPEIDPDAAAHEDNGDDLFQDVDPQALAAVLLQALHLQPEEAGQGQPDLEPSANEERVRSETKSSDLQPARGQGWKGWEEGGQGLGEEAPDQEEVETLKSMLQELQWYTPMAKREEHPLEGTQSDVLTELEEYEPLRVHTKRKAPPSEPWEGARKLRQQQHLEHQLLQRRYEELAESRRQAEEARRAAAEEERLADMASDLLLQYLLKDGEESQEEGGPSTEETTRKGGSALLFEDEEGNVAEDKRSNEAPEEEEDGEDIDPNTIDRLIELSSKLHLPADDVIDIINDVEKKKEEVVVPEAPSKGKAPATILPRDKPKKTPAYPPGPKSILKPYYHPLARQPPHRLPKDEDAWNEVLRGDEYPAPKWFRAQPDVLSNHISPRTFQPLASRPYAHLPGSPIVPREEYYEDSHGQEEELENYIEKVLLKRPKGF
ncbi:neurosecretory protein VGF [Paroedura picta]|uniref:neurosecretory protein VGF n=1 Tax=Paroedura picta TaxID=143630 RepID=UPI0040576AC7